MNTEPAQVATAVGSVAPSAPESASTDLFALLLGAAQAVTPETQRGQPNAPALALPTPGPTEPVENGDPTPIHPETLAHPGGVETPREPLHALLITRSTAAISPPATRVDAPTAPSVADAAPSQVHSTNAPPVSAAAPRPLTLVGGPAAPSVGEASPSQAHPTNALPVPIAPQRATAAREPAAVAPNEAPALASAAEDTGARAARNSPPAPLVPVPSRSKPQSLPATPHANAAPPPDNPPPAALQAEVLRNFAARAPSTERGRPITNPEQNELQSTPNDLRRNPSLFLRDPLSGPAPQSDSPAQDGFDRQLPRPLPAPANEGALPLAAQSRAEGAADRPGAQPALPANQAMHPVAQRAEWLAQHGGGHARVLLDPPHLGEVELRVRASGSELRIALVAADGEVRALLESGREFLIDQFASRDLRVSHFEVHERHDSNTANDAAAQRGQRGRDEESHPHERQEDSAAQPEGGLEHASADGSDSPGAATTRVDLRI